MATAGELCECEESCDDDDSWAEQEGELDSEEGKP